MDFHTDGKLVCDFLCVNNNNVPHIVHHLRDMADHWPDFFCYR